MHEDELQEGLVDVGTNLAGLVLAGRGRPVRRGDAGADDAAEDLCRGLGIGREEAGVDLAQHVADRLGLVRELDREGVLELGVQRGHDLGPEALEIAQGQELSNVLRGRVRKHTISIET